MFIEQDAPETVIVITEDQDGYIWVTADGVVAGTREFVRVRKTAKDENELADILSDIAHLFHGSVESEDQYVEQKPKRTQKKNYKK